MNILPLICSFIFIFSCICFTFLRDAKSLVIAEGSLNAAARTERAVNNRIEERKFKRAPAAKKTEPTAPATPKEPKPNKKLTTSIPFRAIIPPPQTAKLSLTPLFEPLTAPSNHIVYQTAAKLLVLLYQDTPIIPKTLKKGWEVQLLNAMLIQEKALDTCESLADLFPKDPVLQEIYYHMLKGTNNYSVEQKVGIPPLGDFFTIGEEKKENTFYFYFAPPALLEALFGPKVAQEILTAEKQQFAKTKTYRILEQAEVQELLFKHHAVAGGLALFEPYLNFSRQIPKKENLTGIDPETEMRITRSCAKK